MSRKYAEKAAREGRAALLPEWLQEGRTVWVWRASLCDEDCCADMVTVVCPRNRGASWGSRDTQDCAGRHPVLEAMTVYDAAALFKPDGILWTINDSPLIRDAELRRVFFPSREAALKNRPERAVL